MADEGIKGIAGRVRDVERSHRPLKLAAIAAQHPRRKRGDIEREHRKEQNNGDDQV